MRFWLTAPRSDKGLFRYLCANQTLCRIRCLENHPLRAEFDVVRQGALLIRLSNPKSYTFRAVAQVIGSHLPWITWRLIHYLRRSIMESILFYNKRTGAGAIGVVNKGKFVTKGTYGADAFARDWTHIADVPLSGGSMLFYNKNTGSGAVGRLVPAFARMADVPLSSGGKFNKNTGSGAVGGLLPDSFANDKTKRLFSEHSFDNWTHVVGVLWHGHGRLLFYNADTGAGAIGFDPTEQSYAAGSFSPGWTHIIPGRSSWRVLFYNSESGAAALDFDPSIEAFGKGAFSHGWTHIANSPLKSGQDALLFYNASTRSGAIGVLGADGFKTIRTYAAGAFSEWTHVIGLDSGFLFIHAGTGAGALGEINGVDFVTTKSYPAGEFSQGWTHIVRSDNAALMEEMQAYCWPLSAAPGESIDFRASTAADTYSVTYVSFQNKNRTLVGAVDIGNSEELIEVAMSNPFEQPGQIQKANDSPEEGCSEWKTSWTLDIPDEWGSGLYAAKCEDDAGAVSYALFVVNPPAEGRASLAVIVNTTTWNAYNDWGGYSRYTVPGDGKWTFSYLRPNRYILNLNLTSLEYHYSSKHQARGELWVLNWLEDTGYAVDVFTDLDLHDGIAGLGDYKAIILNTHPEYWSVGMLDALKAYLDQGGSLLYLGGNGIFDAVDISDDLTQITVYGTSGRGRKHLFRQPSISQPESSVLGVAFPWSSATGDVGNAQSNPRVAYKVVDPSHRFFNDTGLGKDDPFGSQGWCTVEGAASLETGGAAGWECDRRDGHSPANVQLLAVGDTGGPISEMTYYDHPGGGFVFSVGSMSFGGSLVVDEKLQRIVRNVLDECLDQT
jgi:N,N-dimethylformamidase beta subunit-like protein